MDSEYIICFYGCNCEDCAPGCEDQCDFFMPIGDDVDAISLGMDDDERSDFRDEWWDYLYRFYNER